MDVNERRLNINELDLIEEFDLLYDRRIVLYGAGYQGAKTRETLKRAGIRVSFFCDGDQKKHGSFLGGIEVISPAQLRELDQEEEILIVITSETVSYLDEISETISRLSLRTDKVFTLVGLAVALAQNLNDPRLESAFRTALRSAIVMGTEAGYHKTKYLHAKDVAHYMEHRDRILVYNPYKVGSQSITHSLSQIGIGSIHIHALSDRLFWEEGEARTARENLRQSFCGAGERAGAKIITMVREPISRDFSWLFYFMKDIGLDYFMRPGDSFLAACASWFRERLSYQNNNRDWLYIPEFDWFDEEMKAVFGVDVFQYPFDRDRGYSVIRQDNVEILIMKTERLKELESVVAAFVGAPQFRLANVNEGSRVPYKYLYQNTREVIKIPRALVSHYYDGNPRMDHFYTEAEKAAFLKKWEKNIE